jgi:hypothetical protein
LDIYDVDTVALGEDKALHFWIPATGLMSKMDSAIEEFSHCYYRHGGTLLCANFGSHRLWINDLLIR